MDLSRLFIAQYFTGASNLIGTIPPDGPAAVGEAAASLVDVLVMGSGALPPRLRPR